MRCALPAGGGVASCGTRFYKPFVSMQFLCMCTVLAKICVHAYFINEKYACVQIFIKKNMHPCIFFLLYREKVSILKKKRGDDYVKKKNNG